MGIKNFQNNAPKSPPENERVELELLPGEQNQSFQEVQNLRKQFNESYQQYRLRGGTIIKQTLDGNIITEYGFSASDDNVQKNFIAVHTSTGSVYLADKSLHIDPATPPVPPQIFPAATFSLTQQITFIHSGNFLYIFDVVNNIKKVYDIETAVGYDWNKSQSGSLIEIEWNENSDWRKDNIWGYEEGREIIVSNSFNGGEYGTPKTMVSFVTKIESVFLNYFTYQDPEGRQWNSNHNVSIGVLPNSADLAEYIGINGNVYWNPDAPGGGDVEPNTNYEVPLVFRGYLIVDLLADGSVVLPGKPVTVSTSFVNNNYLRQGSVTINIAPPAANVETRYLFCTRWQINERNVFIPSRPEYDNSAFFFAKEIEISQLTFDDNTPDSLLFEPLSSRLPMRAGVPQIFGKGQIDPYSASSIRNNLLIGGYRVNRPIPEPYSNINNPDEKNIQVIIRAGTALTSNPTVDFLFEYTDGKKSELVSWPTVLTDAEQTIAPGGSGTKAFADIEVTVDASGAGDITFSDNTIPSESVTISYVAGEPAYLIMNRLGNAINAYTWTKAFSALGTVTNILRIQADSIGTASNGWVFDLLYTAATIELNGDGSGNFDLTLAGGSEPIDGVVVSGNDVTIHSLNSLVTRVFVLIDNGGVNPKLFREIQSSQSHFHGRLLLLPNNDAEITALNDFTLPVAADVREVVDLYDFMVTGTPFQQLLITDQARVQNSAIIRKIIPTTFDVDKTQMRQRVVIFTDRNIQVGYLVISPGGIDYDFEVIGQGSVIKSRFSAWFVEGNVIYQAGDGIYILNDQGYSKIIDQYQYSTLENDLHNVVFNREHKEYWLFFPGEKVIVTSQDGQIRSRFVWPVAMGDVSCGTYTADILVLGIADSLYLGDVDGEIDGVDDIVGHLVTEHIGNPKVQTKIMEVSVAGQHLDCTVSLDLQKSRLEKNTSVWITGFNSDISAGPKALNMNSSPFTFAHRAVMPKTKINVNGSSDGFISHVHLTYIAIENKGKAR